MYRIMLVKAQRDKYETLYQYLTTTVDGVTKPFEFATREDLDLKVEQMLNTDGYAKSDFIIVQPVDYAIDARDYKGI